MIFLLFKELLFVFFARNLQSQQTEHPIKNSLAVPFNAIAIRRGDDIGSGSSEPPW